MLICKAESEKTIELKSLTEKFTDLVGGVDFSERLEEIIFSDQKDAFFDSWLSITDNDLSTDYFQRIYQYYLADRGDLSQDFTPKSIAQLCNKETKLLGDTVYDVCAGSGSLTIQKWVDDPNKTFICEELDKTVIPFLLANLAIRNIDGFVINRNVITQELFAMYELKSGKRYSTIEKVDDAPEFMADEIVSNPPYNIKWEPPGPLLADDRFFGKVTPPAQFANYVFVLSALAKMGDGGRCAFVLPNGVLTSIPEAECRQYLVESGLLERVILLPEKMFESTSIPVCVLVFSSGNESVKFFDVRNLYEVVKREQRGQFGGASHTGRTYIKEINVLSQSTIDTLCSECENIPGFSRDVPVDEIKQNDFILLSSRYIEVEYEEPTHRPFKDIMDDINRVAKEKSILKITCNETYAKQCGIYEIALLQDENKDLHNEINKTFELLGGHYEGRNYVTLTKSKVFKIENQDKEIWSNIITFFLPMWTQHIHYLNREENRLLAEMRDALLPELMNPESEIHKQLIEGDSNV